MESSPKVIIRCTVYNHEPYLRDCLEGFVMQQTNFLFKAVVHDDASTDNSAAIIREYAEKYPHIIEPIYETENQYSKHDGSLAKIMNTATLGRSPYLAYCEGDDYWIDPLKLQKQVDYMDDHPECSMTCTNVQLLTPNGIIPDEKKLSRGFPYYETSKIHSTTETIELSGHTCTLLVRSAIVTSYFGAKKNYIVGDYPLQIYASFKGHIYCFADITAVYRYMARNSWTSRHKLIPDIKKAIIELGYISMLEDLNLLSHKRYNLSFEAKIYTYASNAIINNPQLANKLCRKYGHIFLKHPIQNHYKKSLFNILLRIKWFPFKPGKFIDVLKKASWRQRIQITYTCIKSYLKKLTTNSHI